MGSSRESATWLWSCSACVGGTGNRIELAQLAGTGQHLGTTPRAQFVDQMVHVGLDRRLARYQPLGDGTVRQAQRQQVQDIALTGSEQVGRRRRSTLAADGERPQHASR